MFIETTAGVGVSFRDVEYSQAGCAIISTAKGIYARAEMIVKVKESEECEYELLRDGQILYTHLHLHLASNKKMA